LDPRHGKDIAAALGIKLTHPDKVVYDGTDVTKATLATYYAAVADRILPHISDRPLTLVRDADSGPGGTFFQKHKRPGMPVAIHDGQLVRTSGKDSRILWVEDLAGLIGGVQMNVLEFHVWGSRREEPDLPDRMVFDIDPDEGLDFGEVKKAAFNIRDALGEWGLESFPMVTGGKGIHVIAPLRAITEWPLIKDFCHAFADRLEATQPERFTSNIRKAKRKGRMFVDYLRNERGSTAIGPFSTRARKGCPVAVPVSWSEVDTLEAANLYTLETAAARAQEKDPWPDYDKLTQSITKGMVEAVAGPVK
jgi:bifunctional non-homologous end joining protein LigD